MKQNIFQDTHIYTRVCVAFVKGLLIYTTAALATAAELLLLPSFCCWCFKIDTSKRNAEMKKKQRIAWFNDGVKTTPTNLKTLFLSLHLLTSACSAMAIQLNQQRQDIYFKRPVFALFSPIYFCCFYLTHLASSASSLPLAEDVLPGSTKSVDFVLCKWNVSSPSSPELSHSRHMEQLARD